LERYQLVEEGELEDIEDEGEWLADDDEDVDEEDYGYDIDDDVDMSDRQHSLATQLSEGSV
jgi:hypothetical protein